MASKACDGNCLTCSFGQQVYCAAQRSYALMKNEEAMFSHIEHLEEAIGALKTAFERFGGESIINPFEGEDKEQIEIAQDGGGAENRSPEQ